MFKEHRNMSLYIESLKKLSLYTDEFDTIYPSHGTFPVSPGLIGSLIEGAGQIINGTAKGKVVDMFGTPVMFYKFPYAGFLCVRCSWKHKIKCKFFEPYVLITKPCIQILLPVYFRLKGARECFWFLLPILLCTGYNIR